MTTPKDQTTIGGSTAPRRATRVWAGLTALLALFALWACYPYPHRQSPYPPPGARVTPLPAPSTQVYFYPKMGQSNDQQSRDHYECYNWAITQTGFDPGQSAIPREERVRIVPMPPPGHDTATLAIAGAVLGALIGGRRHAVGGAIIGGTTGAIAGAASDSARAEAAQRQQEAYATQADRARMAQLEAQSATFRRAMSACLEGRGYTVR
jgi:outer membrane lipoprotein SlyB